MIHMINSLNSTLTLTKNPNCFTKLKSCEAGNAKIEYVILLTLISFGLIAVFSAVSTTKEDKYNTLTCAINGELVNNSPAQCQNATPSVQTARSKARKTRTSTFKPVTASFSMDFANHEGAGDERRYTVSAYEVVFSLKKQLPGQKHYEAPGIVQVLKDGELVASHYVQDMKSASPADVRFEVDANGNINLAGKFQGGNIDTNVTGKIEL